VALNRFLGSISAAGVYDKLSPSDAPLPCPFMLMTWAGARFVGTSEGVSMTSFPASMNAQRRSDSSPAPVKSHD